MDMKEQDKSVEEMMCGLENMRRQMMKIEKLKDEIRHGEKEWIEERNKFKKRIKKLKVRCEKCNKNTKNGTRQLIEGRKGMDNKRENAKCVCNKKIKIIEEWIREFEKMIETLNSFERCAQNQNSNTSQSNESNRPNATSNNTASDNRENHISSINSDDFNNLTNRSNQSTSRDSRSANNTTNMCDNPKIIMCKCNKPAALFTVKRDKLKKGHQFYKCDKRTCKLFKWVNKDIAKFQGNTEKCSKVSSLDRSNDNPDHFSHTGTSNNNWENPTMNVMHNYNQPAQKLTVCEGGLNKGRQFYESPQNVDSNCNFFKRTSKNDNRVPENTNTSKKLKLTACKKKCGICRKEGHIRNKCPNMIPISHVPYLFVMNYIEKHFPNQ